MNKEEEEVVLIKVNMMIIIIHIKILLHHYSHNCYTLININNKLNKETLMIK